MHTAHTLEQGGTEESYTHSPIPHTSHWKVNPHALTPKKYHALGMPPQPIVCFSSVQSRAKITDTAKVVRSPSADSLIKMSYGAARKLESEITSILLVKIIPV